MSREYHALAFSWLGAQMQFWRPAPWKYMDVVCGEGFVRTAASRHVHEAVQILLPLAPLAATTGIQSVVVGDDSIHVTRPLEPCMMRGVHTIGFTARVILVGPTVLAKASDSGPTQGGVVRNPQLAAAFSALFDELRRPVVDLDCASRLVACLQTLLTMQAEPMTSARISEGVLRARDYLRSHVVETVTLDELARAAYLSKFYLLRSFQRAFGLTPREYQMQLRLARARRLLAEGMSLSRVTYDAGFADQSHLTRRFADFYGLTPARFARQASAPFVPLAPQREGNDESHAAHAA